MSLEISRQIQANGRHEGCEEEYTDFRGAQRLKDEIEAVWAKRGFSVEVQIVNAGFNPACRAARYDVRSDMKNGLPFGVKEWSQRRKTFAK